MFIAVNTNPVCLICNKCLTMCKESTVIWEDISTHHKLTSALLSHQALLLGGWKIFGITSCYEQSRSLFLACTDHDRATAGYGCMDIRKKEKAVYRLRDNQGEYAGIHWRWWENSENRCWFDEANSNVWHVKHEESGVPCIRCFWDTFGQTSESRGNVFVHGS